MRLEAVGLVFLLGFLFGSDSVVARYMLGQFDPMTFTALRLSIAAAAFLVIYIFGIGGHRWPKDKQLWRNSIFFGVIGDAVQLILYISALRYLSAGLSSILFTFFPVVSVVLAHFLLPNEKLSIRTGIGVAMGSAGAIVITTLGETGLTVSEGNTFLGYLLLLLSGLLICFFNIYARKYMAEYNTMDTVCIRIISAAVVSTVFALLFEPNGIHQVNGLGIALLLYAAVVYFAGFILTFYILQRFGVTISSLVNYVSPVSASVLGLIFLKEVITPGMLGGMALILGGVTIINFIRKKPGKNLEVLQSAEES